jgi:hypothetical protein
LQRRSPLWQRRAPSPARYASGAEALISGLPTMGAFFGEASLPGRGAHLTNAAKGAFAQETCPPAQRVHLWTAAKGAFIREAHPRGGGADLSGAGAHLTNAAKGAFAREICLLGRGAGLTSAAKGAFTREMCLCGRGVCGSLTSDRSLGRSVWALSRSDDWPRAKSRLLQSRDAPIEPAESSLRWRRAHQSESVVELAAFSNRLRLRRGSPRSCTGRLRRYPWPFPARRASLPRTPRAEQSIRS